MEKYNSPYSPVYIIGNPRSGTTLLRLMLTAHRQMVVPPECGFAMWLYPKYCNWGKTPDSHITLVNDFLADMFVAKKIENWKLNHDDVKRHLLKDLPQSYRDLISTLYFYYGSKIKPDITLWGDKNNFHLNYIKEIHDLFPEAKLIHIIRDGRAVMGSYQRLNRKNIVSENAPKLPSSAEAIAEEWSTNIHSILKAFNSIPSNSTLEIRFEDLVTEPALVLNNICEFIGLEFDPGMLEYYKLQEKDGLEPSEYSQWKEKNSQPVSIHEIKRYRQEVSQEDIKQFETICNSLLTRYSYL